MRKSIISLIVIGLVFGVVAALTGNDLVASAQNTKPKTGRCDPMKQEQTDLSGTYTGKINYPDGGLSGDATLTITGNEFTVTAGSQTHSGRITAVTTCGYTAVTLMAGDFTPPDPRTAPPAHPAVSLRARKVGNHITLTSVPGETRKVSFSSGGSRPHKRKPRVNKAATPPAPPE